MSERLVRAQAPRILASRDALVLVALDGTVRRLEGDSATLAQVVLDHCAAPRTRAEIIAHVEAEAGAAVDPKLMDELLSLLRGAAVLVAPRDRRTNRTSARALVAMGGGIAAADAPSLVRALQAKGFEVRVIATERALCFASKDALEALTHAPVLASIWPPEGATMHVPHVELAAWADVMIVWPATATTIGRIASGDCSELVSAVAITTRAPVLVAPSMNESMLDAPAVARNVATLRADRFFVTASAFAHEVADAPGERDVERGGAPDPITLADLALALVRTSSRPPRDAESWESFHRRIPEDAQPWVGEADPIVLRMLDRHASRGGSLWDVGTGHGALAIAAAQRGFRVVATDVSATALDRARARGGDQPIAWVEDDVLDSKLRMDFAVVVDRGTLHTIPTDRRSAYVDAIADRTRAEAIVLVTAHLMTEAEIVTSFGDRFAHVATEHGPFAGALSPAPAAITVVLRRVTSR
jgi:hypothetical protein